MRERLSPAALFTPEIRPYLKYSAVAHLTLALAGWRVLSWQSSSPPPSVYSIDFVGGPAAVITSVGAPTAPAPRAPAAAAPAAKPPPQAEFDEFGRRQKQRKPFALRQPSLLRGWQRPETAAPQPPSAAPARAETSAAPAGAGAGAGEAGVSADMPDFPYPWYITRVRDLLWQQWQSRMPRQQGECVVVFSLLANGSVVDLRTETSSGDSAFDIAALSAVQDAAPYPPLPRGFAEKFLKVHVTLRSQ